MNVRFIDTSVMLNLLEVPGRSVDSQMIKKEFRQTIENKEILILPVATIIETGNHIAHINNGNCRRTIAATFGNFLRKTAEGEAPWQLYGKELENEGLLYLADHIEEYSIQVTLNKKQCELRGKLVDQIHARGFEAVVEEVAYTWFNRICAIRFMEVNDYMYPVRVRVLSSEKEGKNEPDVVTMAPDIDWNFTDKEREEIIDAKMNNRLDDLFRMLFMKQCNLLHEVLPGLFEETEDYTEMLLNISFTNEDDVIRMLVDGIDEKDFNITSVDEDGKVAGQVEIIGWLYQYYNTEPKNKAFAKKTKITKEEVPTVTQLFTPDWIVRYMVENSLGRMWVEGHPDDELKSKWKYYLDEAEQEESVQQELNKIKAEYATLKPEDIKLIDPCMGSGHILLKHLKVNF